jgi:hypothetical protein
MALVFIDSFDHYTQDDFLKKWSNTNAAFQSISTTAGRRGGGCMTRPYETYKNLPNTYSTLIAGFAVNRGVFNTGQSLFQFAYFGSGATKYVSLGITSAGEVQVFNASGTSLGRTKPGLINQATWAYVEFKAVVGATTGAVEIRVNGISELLLTNVNTGTSNFATFGFGIGGLPSQENDSAMKIDDVYLLDTSGTANTDFLGDCRVDAYLPTSEGATQSWTPTPAGTHYTTVDEIPINSADYVESAAAGAIELFGYTDLVNIPLNIFGIQVNSAARKTDAGVRQINSAARISSTDYFSANLPVSDTTSYVSSIWDRSPATSAAWTRTEINGTDFGVKLV